MNQELERLSWHRFWGSFFFFPLHLLNPRLGQPLRYTYLKNSNYILKVTLLEDILHRGSGRLGALHGAFNSSTEGEWVKDIFSVIIRINKLKVK